MPIAFIMVFNLSTLKSLFSFIINFTYKNIYSLLISGVSIFIFVNLLFVLKNIYTFKLLLQSFH